VEHPRTFDSDTFFRGCMLIVSGIVRKCVIADNCATIANAVFDGRLGHSWLAQLIGIYAFAFQIYGDFAGYSDIARGSAQVLGFHFMVNFRQPYFSWSLQEFWRRWHISLSTWLRDYLYFPLGGSRKGVFNTYRNLFLTMLIGGLWHGANWTFVIWGALQGGGLILERVSGFTDTKPASMIVRVIRGVVVFHFVCLGWIFFRATSLRAAVDYLRGFAQHGSIHDAMGAVPFLTVFIGLCLVIDLVSEAMDTEYVLERFSARVQTVGAAFALLLASLASTGQASAFLYFQF
jgi:D-alanyl-lipoteichoic acid acyltransferase DltB (MBOAT superfamily)